MSTRHEKKTLPPVVGAPVSREIPVPGGGDDHLVLAAVLDTAVDAIVTIDARGTIEIWNKAAERLFGYTSAEVVGKNISLAMPEPHASRHDLYMHRYLTTGKTAVIGHGRELMARRKDGTLFPMELTVSEFKLGSRRMFTGIVRDTSDRRRLEKQILEASSAEQRRIGQDLHDGLCQQLTAISFATSSLRKRLGSSPQAAAEKATEIARLLDSAITQARALARGLCPVPVDAGGLMPALAQLADNISTAFGVECSLLCPAVVKVPDPDVANHLYRIAQEASSNALRHGKSKKITIALEANEKAIVLTVSDDGVGIPPLTQLPNGGGVGLHIMRYRSTLIGASFDIRPGGQCGTIVTCTVPRRSGDRP